MQQSLRHRFRGALLGAVLGETLGGNWPQSPAPKPSQWFAAWSSSPSGEFSASASSNLCWSQIAARQSQILIDGKSGENSCPEASLLPSTPALVLAGMAVATLPIALYYHEDWYQLQHGLEQTVSAWTVALPISAPPITRLFPHLLTVAYTISLTLRERLHLDTLIARLITDLELYDRDPQLMQQLSQVQSWVQQRKSVAILKSLMQETCPDPAARPIPVALYGFLSTPTDFQISLLRTAQILAQPQLSCAIVAALSGAYNGIAGIPLHWRRAYNSAIASPSLSPSATETDLLQQADLLWATWSGAENPIDWLQRPLHPTIASPHLIRPRLRS